MRLSELSKGYGKFQYKTGGANRADGIFSIKRATRLHASSVELSLPMVRLIMVQRTDAFYPDEAFIVGLRVLQYRESGSMRPEVRRLGSSIDIAGSAYLF